MLKHVGGQTRDTNFVPLRLVRIHFVSPVFTNPLSLCTIASQPLCPVFHFPVYSCVLDHLCVSECCLRSYCSYVPRKCTLDHPSPQSRQRGEGYLDSGKVRDGLLGCFVLVLILHFSPVFFFSLFFKLAMAILLAR